MTPGTHRYPWLFGIGVMLVAVSGAGGDGAKGGSERDVLFRDTFAGKLADGWTWVREDPKAWRVGGRGLEVRIHHGNMWGPANDAKNVLVRPAPDPGDKPLEVTASVENKPTNQWEQVDLCWYYGDGHMVKLGQELVDGVLSIVMGREENDRARTVSITPLDSEKVELRLTVTANKIRGSFKTPTADWRDVGECDLPVKGKPHISLQFYRAAEGSEHWARVSELTVRRLP